MMMVSQRSAMGAWLLLCCCCYSAASMRCRWLQPGQELLSRRILLTFHRLRNGELFPTQCLLNTFPPNIDFIYNTEQLASDVCKYSEEQISQYICSFRALNVFVSLCQDLHEAYTPQVEIAVLTLSNVLHQINKLYSKPHLSFEQKKLEPFLASLGQQISDLRDCVSMNTFNVTSQGQTRKAIDEHFKKLEDISSEKDNSLCAWNIIMIQVNSHLQRIALLSTRMRKLAISKMTSST